MVGNCTRQQGLLLLGLVVLLRFHLGLQECQLVATTQVSRSRAERIKLDASSDAAQLVTVAFCSESVCAPLNAVDTAAGGTRPDAYSA